MRSLLIVSTMIAVVACRAERSPASGQYLYVWAGDSAGKASDFLAVIDAAPSSATYGAVVASLPTGVAGTHPHHTEAELGPNNHLLANGFHAGRTWLYDLSAPRAPKILTSFGDVAGFSHPHTYIRLPNGNVLATFQYKADSASSAPMAPMSHDSTRASATHTTGGIVEMDERGNVVRSASAADSTIQDRFIYPYAVLPIESLDRAVSTTTDMDETNKQATSQWVQLWRYSNLQLLRTIELKPGPRGDEQRFTGEPRLLPDGKSVYIHTFNCGLYLVRGIDTNEPTSTFVKGFEGADCGVPLLTSHYWLAPVPALHALVSLDITDPEHPREVSTLDVGGDEKPHWVAIDRTGRRIVLSSAGAGTSNRILIIDFDPSTGKLSMDEKFRDAGATRPGVRLTDRSWPHGFHGTAWPHGTVFSR